MPIGLGDYRRRRRRQFRWAAIKWLIGLALIAGAGAYAYQSGARLANARIDPLEHQVSTLQASVADLTREKESLVSALTAERASVEKWQKRYEQDIPTGPMRGLLASIAEKLASGMSGEQLRAVIAAAEADRVCDSQPIRKRLVVAVQSPAPEGSAAGFGEGGLTLGVSGAQARDSAGNPESWFDASQPVTVRIQRPGGRSEQSTGPLPQHPTVIVGTTEYRFTIAADARGLVQVTMLRCHPR